MYMSHNNYYKLNACTYIYVRVLTCNHAATIKGSRWCTCMLGKAIYVHT